MDNRIPPPPAKDPALARHSYLSHHWVKVCLECGERESTEYANWPCGHEKMVQAVQNQYGEDIADMVDRGSPPPVAEFDKPDASV